MIKTLEKISSLALFLLTYLVKSNPPTKTRLVKKIRTTKKIPGVRINKDRIAVITLLSEVPILFF